MIKRRRRASFFHKQPSFYSSQIEAPPLKLRWWQQLLIIFIVLLAGLASWYLFFSNTFEISEVTVENNNEVSTDQIRSAVSFEGQNIFLIDADLATKVLKQNSEIYDVRIVRVLPNKIRVIITEHKPILIWQSLDNSYYVNQSGIAYKQINGNANGSILRVIDIAAVEVVVGESVVPRSFIHSFQIMKDKLTEIYKEDIDFFEVEETVYDLDLITKNGQRVRFNILSDVENQINELKRLQQLRPDLFTKSYIDLRVDRWAYTR